MTKRIKKTEENLVLGLDLGSTSLKAVAVEENGRLRGFMRDDAARHGPDAAPALAARLTEEFDLDWDHIRCIGVTGLGSLSAPESLNGVSLTRISEFDAIGLGGLSLAKRKRALVVSMGTGTAFVKAGPEGMVHLGGSGVGGGIITGLARHLYGLEHFPDIIALAEKGDLAKVDLKMGDVLPCDYFGLAPELTASNFAKITCSATREDFLLALINMVLEVIGMMSVMICRAGSIDAIVATGSIAAFPRAHTFFTSLSSRSGLPITIPPNSPYSTALGSALSCMEG